MYYTLFISFSKSGCNKSDCNKTYCKKISLGNTCGSNYYNKCH